MASTLNILEGIKNDSDFRKLLEFKDICKKNVDNKPYNKAITFKKVIDILKVDSEDIIKFKEFIIGIDIIDDIETPNDKIFVNWEDLNLIIFDYDTRPDLKELLKHYYINIQRSFDKIIDRIEAYNTRMSPTLETYQKCIKNSSDKINKTVTEAAARAALIKATQAVAAKMTALELELANSIRESKAYEKKYKGSAKYDEIRKKERVYIEEPREINEVEIENAALYKIYLAETLAELLLVEPSPVMLTMPNMLIANAMLSMPSLLTSGYASDDDKKDDLPDLNESLESDDNDSANESDDNDTDSDLGGSVSGGDE